MSFRLAPMCPFIRWLTIAMLALPVGFSTGGLFGARALWGPAVLVILIYGWVWTRFRPTRFVVHPHALEVIWPLKRRQIPRDRITSVRVIDRKELKRMVGWGARVGAGGLWGGFGWLWTEKRGIVQMYVSRLDRFVWIERGSDRPWILTPDQPEALVDSLSK